MKEIQELFPLLDGNSGASIVITTHHKPDADALGSSLGLYHFLVNAGFRATVVSPTDYGNFLKWMPGEQQVVNFEHHPGKSATLVAQADVIFCLDFNSLKRINQLGPLIAQSKAVKVMVDHHQEPEGFDDYRLWTVEASSTCQLVYEMMVSWKGEGAINKDIASCLYAGIMTDTGSFRFDSVKPQTHLVAASLLAQGVDHARIHNLIYDSFSLERMRFIGYCLSQKLEILPDLPVAIMSITAEELNRYHIQTGDTEGLVNYGLSIEGIELSVLFVDRTKLVKISFRGKGKFPANSFSRDFFDGGGHFSAAGGQSELSLEATVEKFKEKIHSYKAYLT